MHVDGTKLFTAPDRLLLPGNTVQLFPRRNTGFSSMSKGIEPHSIKKVLWIMLQFFFFNCTHTCDITNRRVSVDRCANLRERLLQLLIYAYDA